MAEKATATPDENKPTGVRSFYHNWLKPLVIMLAVLFAVRSSLADWNDVPTQSMEPTILVGDRIAVNKLAYGLKFPFTTWHLLHWSGPKRGEIVVFYSPKNGDRMVKRIVGVPGLDAEQDIRGAARTGSAGLSGDGSRDAKAPPWVGAVAAPARRAQRLAPRGGRRLDPRCALV